MWLLHFLPDSLLLWAVNATVILGIVLTLAAFFMPTRWNPALEVYRLPAQIIGVLILVLGIYWKGGYGVEMEWRGKIAELEQKVKVAEQKAAAANKKIKTRVVTKIKRVKEKQKEIQTVIKEKEKIINKDCRVPREAIEILNKAAEPPVVGETQ